TEHCDVTVRPVTRDHENGGRTDLVPGRYGLRTRTDEVKVKPADDGWTFLAPRGTSSIVEYFVTDLQKGEVVLNDRVSMNCSVHTSAGSGNHEPTWTQTPMPTKRYEPAPEPAHVPDPERRTSAQAGQGCAFTANLGLGSAVVP